MSAADCYELARAVYNLKDFKNAIAWSMEALRKYRDEIDIEHTFTETDIHEYIGFAYFLTG